MTGAAGLVFYTLDNSKAGHAAPGGRRRALHRLPRPGQHCGAGLDRGQHHRHRRRHAAFRQSGAILFDFTDQTTPFEDRWGGWYVTGTHRRHAPSGQCHRPDPQKPYRIAAAKAAQPSPACRAGSTPAMSLQAHQRYRGPDDAGASDRLHQPRRDVAERSRYYRCRRNLDDLVAYMTFADEAPLPGPVSGNSAASPHVFAGRGPRDGKGRSLARTSILQTPAVPLSAELHGL